MSIYATFFQIEDERQWIADLKSEGIDAGVIRDGEPSFDDLDAPIIYQGSHVLPSNDDPRGGSVDLALIPGHITRDGRDERDGPPWPWLRLGVSENKDNHSTVVLTAHQATRLRDALTEWIDEQETT